MGRPQMTHSVGNVSLKPTLLKTTSERTFGATAVTKQICRTVYIPIPRSFDPATHSGIANASCTPVKGYVCITGETHSGKARAVETSTVTLDMLDQMVKQKVTTVNSVNSVGHAASQST